MEALAAAEAAPAGRIKFMPNINNETLVDILKAPEYKPSGVKNIKQAILDGDWLGTVNIWVVRRGESGLEVLYQKRPDDSYFAGGYFDVSVAGYYESGEYDSGDHFREFKEELGVDIDSNKTYFYGRRMFALINSNTGRERKLVVDIYITELDKELSELNPEYEEVFGLVWAPLESVISLLTGSSKSLKLKGIDRDRRPIEYEITSHSFPYNFDNYQLKMAQAIRLWGDGVLKLDKI